MASSPDRMGRDFDNCMNTLRSTSRPQTPSTNAGLLQLDVETRLSITNTINAVRMNLDENQSAAPSLLLAAVAAEMGLADEL
eukprot:7378679-Prymnesium_polylepis.1